MIIREGYAGEPLELRVSYTDGNRAEIWTEMYDAHKHDAYGASNDKSEYRTELLHYAEIGELIGLRNEINEAIKALAGV